METKALISGGAYYLGKHYDLQIMVKSDTKKPTVQVNAQSLTIICADEQQADINKVLKSFYTKAARKLIADRLQYYQPLLKLKYRAFAIESSASRWGSCNFEKKLTFNWRLMMLPPFVIDYVVVHELCHLKHMNHDRSFWRLVGKIYPDYKKAMVALGAKKKRDL